MTAALVDTLDLDSLQPGKHKLLLRLAEDGLGRPVRVPILVCKGERPGPVFGLTAALHGDELNGIPVVHRVIEKLDPTQLRGTVAGVVVANVPGVLRHQRRFDTGEDLNHLFPGRPEGTGAQIWAHRLLGRVVRHFNVLLDLHTASRGRVNSLYVRADMDHEVTSVMANLLRPQIIVHNPARDGTLRGAAMDAGIPAITVEVGNPSRFQRDLVKSTVVGVRAVMRHFDMIGRTRPAATPATLVCSRSYWLRTDRGGLLSVLPSCVQVVEKGELVARQTDAFGDVVREIHAPERGVVVGKSVEPVSRTGSRVLHLGVLA
jgi:predicted deacylase